MVTKIKPTDKFCRQLTDSRTKNSTNHDGIDGNGNDDDDDDDGDDDEHKVE